MTKPTTTTPQPTRRSIFQLLQLNRLATWIFLGLFLGLLLGGCFPQAVFWLKPFQTLFLHGVKCAIAPLIFSTIVTGIASAGNFKQLGKMGARTFLYFEVVTTLALAIGLLVVNLLQPGAGLHLHLLAEGGGAAVGSATSLASPQSILTYTSFIEHLLPLNIAKAVVENDVLQIVIFSLLFGMGVLSTGEKAKPILVFCESLADVMFKFISYIMYLAPLGVCAALSSAVAEHGWLVLLPLLKLVGALYFALFLFVLVVFYPICQIYGIPVWPFLKHLRKPVLYAFATTSSESSYPLALQGLADLGVPRRISSFVLPIGYSFNLDGSTLYLSMASIFVAQVSGIQLSLQHQVVMMLTLMLTSKGVAAVPRTSIVVLSGTLTTFGLPLEGLALILGVDAFMDMGRSAINLLGNCLAAAVVARAEGIVLGKKPHSL